MSANATAWPISITEILSQASPAFSNPTLAALSIKLAAADPCASLADGRMAVANSSGAVVMTSAIED